MLDIDEDCDAYIEQRLPKHRSQIWGKISKLRLNPRPSDSEKLKGYKESFFRTDQGEHRIIYAIFQDHLKIFVVGPRDGGAVYKQFERKYKNLGFAA
jgi:mRNA-degrading endonuclease RelE of RelBE toxin-antitoxin system